MKHRFEALDIFAAYSRAWLRKWEFARFHAGFSCHLCNPDASSGAVRQALESDSDELKKKRIEIAALNTWQH